MLPLLLSSPELLKYAGMGIGLLIIGLYLLIRQYKNKRIRKERDELKFELGLVKLENEARKRANEKIDTSDDSLYKP